MAKYDHAAIEATWQERWRQLDAHRASDDFSSSRRPRLREPLAREEGELEGVGREKFYALAEFPYPSGDGLHVGHLRSYTAMDIIARKRRMEGWNVLYPMGWDAFGLPAENYAVKTGQHPAVTTAQNIVNFRRQLTAMGFSFDWSREVNTTDPVYYKWTQWIFLKLLEHGLAYKARVPINWCPSCKIGLANEEAVGGVCERCGCPVEQREKEQWMLRITKYADKLLAGLDTVDYIERAKTQQRNWIGRSEGARIRFRIVCHSELRRFGRGEESRPMSTRDPSSRTPQDDIGVEVFTTRPDTLFGATYVVLAPEYGGISNLKFQISNWSEVEQYIAQARQKKEIERAAEDREKTGVELKGIRAVNPANGEEIPVWIADYVLGSYGAGAIMAVPAHDERDFAFAKKYGLPMVSVIARSESSVSRSRESAWRDVAIPVHEQGVYTGDGILINSGTFDGMRSEDAKRAMTEQVGGTMTVTYKLRDWVFSRQRYWGEPIPVVFCAGCVSDRRGGPAWPPARAEGGIEGVPASVNAGGDAAPPLRQAAMTVVLDGIPHTIVPIPEDQLPVTLPEVEKYQPTDTGESPLANIAEWVNTKCPRCGGSAKRETDVMPNWAGSSWYYLAYAMHAGLFANDPHRDGERGEIATSRTPRNDGKSAWSVDALKYWLPVDWYNGGMEHTTLHVLYSRFWNLFLHDIGAVPVAEPYAKRTSHGMILAEDGEKMSKSRGNVVNPDAIVAQYGADAVRVYEMFIGPFDQAVPWSTNGLVGCRRFLEKVAALIDRVDAKFQEPNSKFQTSTKHQIPNSKQECQSQDPLIHRTIKKVSEDIEGMRFNTAISAMMECVNALGKREQIAFDDYVTLLMLLAPFAPHLCEELHAGLERRGGVSVSPLPTGRGRLRGGGARAATDVLQGIINNATPSSSPSKVEGENQTHSIFSHPWPTYDSALIAEQEADLVIQVNGKVRGTMHVHVDITEADATARALAEPNVAKHLGGKQPTKVIFVAGRILNIVCG